MIEYTQFLFRTAYIFVCKVSSSYKAEFDIIALGKERNTVYETIYNMYDSMYAVCNQFEYITGNSAG